MCEQPCCQSCCNCKCKQEAQAKPAAPSRFPWDVFVFLLVLTLSLFNIVMTFTNLAFMPEWWVSQSVEMRGFLASVKIGGLISTPICIWMFLHRKTPTKTDDGERTDDNEQPASTQQ